MARYERTFLVPYLNDICTLHLSKKKLLDMTDQAQKEIERIREEAISHVEPPRFEKKKVGKFIVRDLTGMLILLIGGGLFLISYVDVVYLLMSLVFIGTGLALEIHAFKADKGADKELQTRNEEIEREYQIAQVAAVESVEHLVSVFKLKINSYKEEIDRIEGLLGELYSANVIPRWYRDLYPAVYLDDYFTNSRFDDLDMAINTLVLEQIKEKLDVIIKNQGEELINQRIIIANQERRMEQAERHHNALMSKLDEIQATAEEQKSYLQMINAHTSTSAFFAEASYLRG